MVFRRPGEERTLDAELRGVLEQIRDIIKKEGGKARSSAVMTSVYASNPSHRRVCQTSGGIKCILKFTPSLELSIPSAGGENHIQSVLGETTLRFSDSGLGEQLRIGKFLELRE